MPCMVKINTVATKSLAIVSDFGDFSSVSFLPLAQLHAMNNNPRLPARKAPPKHAGFSLVITLMMMVLLTILALGMLSLSTISLRTADSASGMAVARANARLALMLAIGDLQRYAGPDQRVTAPADITGATTNTRWTGVWSTTKLNTPTAPVVGGHTDPNYLIDLRSSDASMSNGAWKNSLRLGWLVSGSPTAVPAPGSTNNTIELVGQGTLGSGFASTDQVKVPLVLLNTSSTGGTTGGYGYWVGDESQKARIDQASPYTKTPNPSNLTEGGYYRLAGADGPGFAKVKAGTSTPYAAIDGQSQAVRQKMLSRQSIALAVSSTDPPKRNFHDVTTTSQSVLADVRNGGLKKDLTSFLESPSGIPVVSGIQETGLTAGTAILPGAHYQTMGPNFTHLKNWYGLRTKVTGTLGNATISPQFPVSRAATTGNSLGEGYNMDLTKQTQPIHPVLADVRVNWDASLDPNRNLNATGTAGSGRGVRLHVYPRVTLWNPYNVTLKAARYVVGASVVGLNGFKIGGQPATADGSTVSGKWYADATSGNADPQNNKMVYFTLDGIDMAPGECLVFSPDYTKSTGTKLGGNSSQYVCTDVGANVLSANIPTGQNNFYFNSGFSVNALVTSLAGNISYGCTTDVNSAYSEGRMFCLKQAATGSMPYSIVKSASCATIDSILQDRGGRGQCSWWDVFPNNDFPANNRAAVGFADYTQRTNINPPRLWYNEGRLRWMDESAEASAAGHWGAADGGARGAQYNNAVIGNFNVRATNIHRSPFCFFDGWPNYSPGPTVLPWASPQLGDPAAALPFTNSKAHGSPFGMPNDYSQVHSFAMFDLPVAGMPVFSLAQFQHAQLGFQGWQPTYVVGQSLAEPRCDRDKTVQAAFYGDGGGAWGTTLSSNPPGSGNWSDLIQGATSETLAYDSAFMVNEMLFDRYFLSTVPYDPSGSGSVTWNMTSDLPNSRLVLQRSPDAPDTTMKTYFTGTKPFDYASYFLMNKGAFNINSTSVEAWKAFFSTLNRVGRPDATGGTALNTFSRLLYPASSVLSAGVRSPGAWSGVRTLTDAEISSLATSMVAVVKTRGPFLGLADFVNRRLAPAGASTFDDETYCGSLQAAIEKAGLNTTLETSSDATSYSAGGGLTANAGSGCYSSDVNAFFKWKTYGAPGYLTQGDLLQTLAPNMTARGDTFVVRTYGDSRDSTGKVVARAWCEATIQRTADYLFNSTITKTGSAAAGNNPLDPMTIRNPASFALVANSSMQAVNKTFGRRMTVVDFRWLNPSEI